MKAVSFPCLTATRNTSHWKTQCIQCLTMFCFFDCTATLPCDRLVLSFDITPESTMLDDMWPILSNKEAIAINQQW